MDWGHHPRLTYEDSPNEIAVCTDLLAQIPALVTTDSATALAQTGRLIRLLLSAGQRQR